MPSSTTRVSVGPTTSALPPQSRSSSKDTSLFATLTRKVDATPKGKPRDVAREPKADKFKDELNRASESQKPKREKDEVERESAAKKSGKTSNAKKADRAAKSRKPEADESVEEVKDESVETTDDATIESTDVEETDAPVDEAKPDHDVDSELDETAVDPNLAAAMTVQNPQVETKTDHELADDEGDELEDDAAAAINGTTPAVVLKKPAGSKTSPNDVVEAIEGDADGAEDDDADSNASQFNADVEDGTFIDPDAQSAAKSSSKKAVAPSAEHVSESSTWGAAALPRTTDGKTSPKTQADVDATAAMNAVDLATAPTDGSDDAERSEKSSKALDASSFFAKTLEMFGGDAPKQASPTTGANGQAPVAKLQPDQQFATDNHPNIVSNVRGNLLPTGGTMHIRLDPPELGQMQISVNVRDGVMTATFETSSDEATRMLSHSLGELKGALEASGVAVDKLHVQQAPKNDQPTDKRGDGSGSQQQQTGDSSARREQERKELLRRMWDKLTNGADPLDTVG